MAKMASLFISIQMNFQRTKKNWRSLMFRELTIKIHKTRESGFKSVGAKNRFVASLGL